VALAQEAQVPNRFDTDKRDRIDAVRAQHARGPEDQVGAFAAILFEHAAAEI
jgi:hypothetical protein